MNQFSDISKLNLTDPTAAHIKHFIHHKKNHVSQYGIVENSVAIYAPQDLHFGLSRMYDAYAKDLAENVQVFREKEEALNWILSCNNPENKTKKEGE